SLITSSRSESGISSPRSSPSSHRIDDSWMRSAGNTDPRALAGLQARGSIDPAISCRVMGHPQGGGADSCRVMDHRFCKTMGHGRVGQDASRRSLGHRFASTIHRCAQRQNHGACALAGLMKKRRRSSIPPLHDPRSTCPRSRRFVRRGLELPRFASQRHFHTRNDFSLVRCAAKRSRFDLRAPKSMCYEMSRMVARGGMVTSFEALERLDAELCRVAMGVGVLRLAMAEGLEALARCGGHHDLGFASVEGYALERCERSARWVQGARALARRLAELPAIRRALLRGEMGFCMAQVIARVAR